MIKIESKAGKVRRIKPDSDKLNFGCGSWYKEGWVNIDMNPRWEPDILCDVENGIPLEDNSIKFVYIKHVIEHISQKKFNYVMSEIHRVCKDGAKVLIYAPYFSCGRNFRMDHLSPITYYTFDYMDGFKVASKKFHFFRKSFGFNSRLATALTKIANPVLSFLPNMLPLIYERFFCWTFPVEEMKIVLEVVKNPKENQDKD